MIVADTVESKELTGLGGTDMKMEARSGTVFGEHAT
jgi:hypothetical protein